MESTSIDKLLDIKINQIQLVEDRGYIISDEDKLIRQYDETDNFVDFYNYLNSLNDKPDHAEYWIRRGFLNKEAIDYYRDGLDNYVNKTLKVLLKDKPSEHKLNWCQYWNADLSKSIVVYYDTKGNTQVSNSTVKTFKNILDEAERLYARIRRTSLYEKNFEGILIVDAKLSPVANSEMSDIARGQVFLESELSFNPSLSIDNQKHSLVPRENVKALLQSLRADKHGLETFKVYDPTIKYYGWKEGDLIKVTRTDYGVNVLSPDSINYKLVVS